MNQDMNSPNMPNEMNVNVQNGSNMNRVNMQRGQYENYQKEKKLFDLLRENSKMLAILFAFFMLIQMDLVQTMVRTFIRMTKVPDNMLFTVSKVFTSLLAVVLFFIVYRNF